MNNTQIKMITMTISILLLTTGCDDSPTGTTTPENANISGTITGQQLRLGTTFTLTDTVTVNGDLTLSKVRADGTGQSLTQDSSANRTLTGTGTLRMGSSLSSVNGMIGTLGSGVKFPPGHVIQTFYAIPTGSLNYTGSATTGLSITEQVNRIVEIVIKSIK